MHESVSYGTVFANLRSLRGDVSDARVPDERAVRYRALSDVPPGVAPVADIYLPSHGDGSSIVLVHGGGFVFGSREMKPMRYLGTQLSAAGIAVCSIDYRLVFRGGGVDEAVDDVCAAIGFWCDRAPRYGLDASRVSIVGLSAGATLAFLAAGRVPRALHRAVCCFGLYEVGHLRGMATVLPRLWFKTSERSTWEARSPMAAPQPTIPVLLLHGDADGIVPVGQSERLAARRQELGLPTRLVVYPGAPHGFFNLATNPACEPAVREIVAHVTGR